MAKIRDLLSQKGLAVTVCAYDALSAVMIEKAGFDLIAIGGLPVAAAELAMPDIGLLTSSEIIHRATTIAQTVSVPVLCDIDTGFGGVNNVWRTVRELEAGGLSGAQIEDQTFPKRCGYLAGKDVIPVEDYLKKLKVALDARTSRDFVIIARTDCKESLGMDEVIRRLNIYADAGADIAMSGSIHTLDEYKRIAKEVSIPVNAIAPSDPSEFVRSDWEKTGVKIVAIFGVPLFAAMKATTKALEMLKNEGTLKPMEDGFFTYDEYAEVVKLSQWSRREEKYNQG